MFGRTLMRNLEDFENPRIVKLSDNLYGASFFLMKLLPARFMLERAVEEGSLKPGGTICESSSGTFGLALAMLAVQYGYKLIIVSDWALDRHLHKRLLELGAHVEIVDRPAERGGLQQARLIRLAKIINDIPNSYWPSQYSNANNPISYGKLSEILIKKLGSIDCLVGPVGSGGSMCGTTRTLRALFPHLHAVGIDTPNSVLFGPPGGKPLELHGLGGAIVPANIDHALFDEIHWLTPVEAFHATRRLHRDHGLFLGPTSGAAYRVADWWSFKNPEKKVVAIFPDEGNRYVETVYNDDWLSSSVSGGSETMRREPVVINSPTEYMDGWSTYGWRRRTLDEILSSLMYQRPTVSSCNVKRSMNADSCSHDSLENFRKIEPFNKTAKVTLASLTRFDGASVAHLDLAPGQGQFVDPLYTVFSDLQNSSNPEFEHPFSIDVCDGVAGFFVLREKSALPEWAPGDAMTLHSFRIGRTYQGKGYGKSATTLIPEWVTSNRPEANRVMLAVNRRNAGARRLYLGSGFQETGATYPGPTGLQDILEYKLPQPSRRILCGHS
ncbi:pyridoxal-phosphate dependent enzyme [Paraburkholderia phytofirmans]